MRIPKPCPEKLDTMPRSADGVHCTSCDRNVVDLRRVPRTRALAVLVELRARDPQGRVCARVRATPDGALVFAQDPSPLSRFALPLALAGSLAACAPSAASERPTTPVAWVAAGQAPTNANTAGDASARAAPAAVAVALPSPRPTQQPSARPDYVELEGDIAFDPP